MAKQFNLSGQDQGSDRTQQLGWLTWWTIGIEDKSASELVKAAKAAGIPDWLTERIAGRSPASAWKAATQLGARGVASPRKQADPAGSMARYLTRDLGPESRAIIREVMLTKDERVSADTVAVVYLVGDRLQGQLTDGIDPDVAVEVEQLLDTMRRDMGRMAGRVDDGRVRAILQAWLEAQYRITVRGSGGVYFIPRPQRDDRAREVEAELLAIREWVNSDAVGSMLSIVEVSGDGATTVDTFRKAADEEIKAEIEEVYENLRKWLANSKMNAGSLMYSADQMVLRADKLLNKIDAITEALGGELAGLQFAADQVRAKAMAVRDGASSTMAEARESKRQEQIRAKRVKSLEKARAAKKAKAEAGDEPKKSGTAKARSAKRKIGG